PPSTWSATTAKSPPEPLPGAPPARSGPHHSGPQATTAASAGDPALNRPINPRRAQAQALHPAPTTHSATGSLTTPAHRAAGGLDPAVSRQTKRTQFAPLPISATSTWVSGPS